MYMAQSALTQWIEYLSDKGQNIPKASTAAAVTAEDEEFVNLIRADIRDGRAVRRTVSIPKWMDDNLVYGDDSATTDQGFEYDRSLARQCDGTEGEYDLHAAVPSSVTR